MRSCKDFCCTIIFADWILGVLILVHCEDLCVGRLISPRSWCLFQVPSIIMSLCIITHSFVLSCVIMKFLSHNCPRDHKELFVRWGYTIYASNDRGIYGKYQILVAWICVLSSKITWGPFAMVLVHSIKCWSMSQK